MAEIFKEKAWFIAGFGKIVVTGIAYIEFEDGKWH